AATVVRAFNPPRIETADYALRSRDGVLRAAAAAQTAARPAPSGPAVFSGRAARSDADEFGSARVRELQETNARLMAELTGIRGMIERQLAGFAWGETRRQAPARAAMLGELLEAGFSAAIARKLVEAVHEDADRIEAREAVGAALDRLMRACASDEDLLDRGGVYALVGPTGVGKTTTTAKLAARCVVRHGAGRLALITTDGYRIGAQEQLRIYGRILGVPVFSVRDAADLRQTLAGLRNKHMVLIDTMGMSQRDRMVAEQAAMLSGAGDVRRLLLLNATARGDTLDDVVRAYAGGDLAGCIFTKVDEAASLAPALDVAVRHELDIRYLTNGQRVPEDLHLPNRAYLLHRALREHGSASPWHLQGDEAGMLLAAGGA
ncbi:MAG TPA: flagellar biosynthesis protein FlhF, partial [Thauera aminoaromatica]|nr:flagellar biosynthesis protein FlhF [Thauera aminoaromatica]